MATKLDARQTILRPILENLGIDVTNKELDDVLVELNKHLSQLRIQPKSPTSTRVKITGADVSRLNGFTLSQTIRNLLIKFDGAEIDFETGEIFESDGTTPLGVDFTPVTLAANEYQWYSVTLVPGTVNADNTIGVQLVVVAGDTASTTLSSATKAAFANGTPLGQVYVQENGTATGLNNIDWANIVQLGTGVGGGSGTGDANEILERFKNTIEKVDYEVVTPNIFSVDEDDLVSSSTAAFSAATSNYNFTAIGQNLVSVQMLDSQFRTEESDVSKVRLEAIWDLTKLDSAATYEVSRDGGNEWQTITMERVDGTDEFFGEHIFTDEASYATSIEYAVGNADTQLALTDTGSGVKRSQEFTVSDALTIKQLSTYINVLGTISGKLTVQVVRDDSGAPSTDPADIVYQSNPTNIALAAGNHTLIHAAHLTLKAGTYHIVYSTDSAYKSSYSASTNELRLRADGSSPTVTASNVYDGTSWSAAGGGEAIVYLLEGRVLDLRVRITSGASDVQLRGYGIYYDDQITSGSTGKFERDFVQFSGDDNLNEFDIGFEADSQLLYVFELGTGQVYRPSIAQVDGLGFRVAGRKVIFPEGTFNKPGETITLEFLQIFEGSLQFDAKNRQTMAYNGLGHSTPALDLSSAGVGPKTRTDNTGVLVEMVVDEDYNLVIKEA